MVNYRNTLHRRLTFNRPEIKFIYKSSLIPPSPCSCSFFFFRYPKTLSRNQVAPDNHHQKPSLNRALVLISSSSALFI